MYDPVIVVIGYLRHYRRWDGTPGLMKSEQRALVREIARELGYNSAARLAFVRERCNGETKGWPGLRKAIRRAEDISESNSDGLVIIPTLDGLRFNLSFLEILKGVKWPIYVCPGRRRVKIVAGRDTNYEEIRRARGWLLSIDDDAEAFADYLSRVRKRNGCIGVSIRAGLQAASNRGVLLGAHQPNSHRLSKAECSKGGQATARKRQQEAERRYRKWEEHIQRWRANGNTLGQIAAKLSAMGEVTVNGRKIGRMQIHRILKRAPSNREASPGIAT